ncbi:MAG: hypothetical protein AAF559_09165 [Pseudomonadota bacterium]
MSAAYVRLRAAIERLASSAEQQTLYLDTIFSEMDGDKARLRPSDEHALELDDLFLEGKGPASGLLSDEQTELIEELDNYLQTCSGQQNAIFWEREALYIDLRWERVRVLAKRALDRLPEIKQEP